MHRVGAEPAVVAVLAGVGRALRARVVPHQPAELAEVRVFPGVDHLPGVEHFPRVRPLMRRAHYLPVHSGAHCGGRGHGHFHACRQTLSVRSTLLWASTLT